MTPEQGELQLSGKTRTELIKEIAALEERCRKQKLEIRTVIEITCSRRPGAAANAVREDYPELTEVIDAAFQTQEKRIAELDAELQARYAATKASNAKWEELERNFYLTNQDLEAQIEAKDTELERLRTALDHAAAALILCGAIKPCETCAKHGKEAEEALKEPK